VICPSPGLRAFHEGIPFEFICLIEATANTEKWLCKPLFIENPKNKERMWHRGDRMTLLHSQQR
jgi:hypothetical protein